MQGTQNLGLWFLKTKYPKLIGFTNLDKGGCLDDLKSTIGYMFSFGTNFFYWNSRKQEVVTQSFTKTEYVTASNVTKQAIWLRKLLANLN